MVDGSTNGNFSSVTAECVWDVVVVSDRSVLRAVAPTGPVSLPDLETSMVILLNLVNIALLKVVG